MSDDQFDEVMMCDEDCTVPETMNIMGMKVGRLTVCAPTSKMTSKGRMWLCRCACGQMTSIAYEDLVNRVFDSCGACKGLVTVPRGPVENLTGLWRGMLHVLRPESPSSLDRYVCKCDCGKVVIRTADQLNAKGPKSCGCLEASLVPGGPNLMGCNHHPLARSWSTFRSRVKRGPIRPGDSTEVDPAWSTYEDYYVWAYSHGWRPGYYILRVDPTKPYGPDNAEIAPDSEAHGRRRSRRTVHQIDEDIAAGCRS